jgi:hypothetical protein
MKIKKGTFSASTFFAGNSIKTIGPAEPAPPVTGDFETLIGFEPIARWDAVVGQTVVDGSIYRPGIVAYSPNGIEKVVFTCNGTEYTVTSMANNPDTGELEYFPEIDTTGLSGESQPIFVSAVVYDNNGEQVAFDQTPKPYGSEHPYGVSPFDDGATRPGEVSMAFVCVSASPDVYYIAPFGHVPNDSNATIGTADNPYTALPSDDDPSVPGGTSALERIVIAVRPSAANYSAITEPIEIRMLSGTYRNYDLNIDSWNLRAHPILAEWVLVNTGTRDDVVIDRQITLSAERVLFRIKNVHIDLADVFGNGSENYSNNFVFTGSDVQLVFDTCRITAYKPETVRINGVFVDNWPRTVDCKLVSDNVRAQYIDCLIDRVHRPDLTWSRGCRIERAAHDMTGGAFHLSLTAVDCSKVNYSRAYADNIHQDAFQGFNAGGTYKNVILRNYNLIRFCGQGPFFSGNTELFSRVAMIDCDFGLTNREPGTGETGIEDGVAFVPDPTRTNTSNPGLNGTGFAVDQIEVDTVDQYDNSQIKDDEQRLYIIPGISTSTPTITLQGRLEDFYIKGCTIFDRSLIKQREYTGAFEPTALASVRCVFEDTFDQDGELFVPGSYSNNAYDDRQSFIALVNGTAAAGLSAVVSVPDLTTDNSEWIAEPTPGTWNSNSYLSIWTSGFRYRVTTGLNRKTQYPT